MAKQMLDSDLVDMELTGEILAAVERAEARGVHGAMIAGTLIGAAVGVGDTCECTCEDLAEVVKLCHQATH